MVVNAAGMVIDVIAVASLNANLPILFNWEFGANVIDFIRVVGENVSSNIWATPAGIVISIMPERIKAPAPRLVSSDPDTNVTADKFVVLLNAPFPINVTVFGIVIDNTFVAFKNASFSIPLTV